MSMAVPQQRIFLSHSSKDHEFCVRLVNDLRRILGDDDAVWYDAHGGLHGGDAWWHKIEQELNTRTTFIVVLSPDAVASAWVNDEIDIAWRRKNYADPASRMRIIPLLLRPCAIRPSLESLQIVSFQPPKAYETALQDLLTALTLPSQPSGSQKTSPVLQNHIARQRRRKRKNTRLARQTFVMALTAGPSMVWFHAFTLLTGLGVLAELLNRLTLLLPWTTAPLALPGVGLLVIPSAIGIVVLVAPLLYFLGYRKALSPFTMLCLAIISAIAIYSLTGFLSSLNFAQHATSLLWFNQTRMLWLGSQVIFGLIMGGIVGAFYGSMTLDSYQDWEEVTLSLFGILVFGLIGWLIPAALSFFFKWGFGFGYAWYLSIASAVVSCLVVASLVFSFSIWRRASATSSASASWQLDIPMPEECQQSSAAALRILTTRPEAIDLLFTLDDHEEGVQSVALSADGLILASSSGTKDIRVWDTQTGQLVRRLTDDEYRTSCIAMSASGYFLASGYGSSIKLLNTQTGQILHTFKRDTWSTNLALALSGNERLLAIDSRDKSIDLWNIQNGQFLRIATGHKYSVERLALSADGAVLASGCAVEKTIKLWDTQSGELIRTLNRSEYSPRCLALSADGSLLASSCNYARTIELWNTHTGQLLHTLEGHEGYVTSVALSADGLILASGSEDRTIKLWNAQTGWLLCTLTVHTKAVTRVALSADGQILASGSEDTTINLWGIKV